jgi:Fur family transcriptional regulator, ferric uptake regulator
LRTDLIIIFFGMSGSRNAWRARAKRSIEGSGRRSGGARLAVVELLAEEDCCLSAHEIADRLRQRGKGVGIASVYRAIELLEEMALVQRVDAGEGGARFEAVIPGGAHHHHAVCDSCGAVTPFEDRSLERAIDRLGGRLDHTVTAHDVVLHGRCARCETAGSGSR